MTRNWFAATCVVVGCLFCISHIVADGCGVTPMYNAPSRCQPPKCEPPGYSVAGSCQWNENSECVSDGCSGDGWGTGIPGRCELSQLIENMVPKCWGDYGNTLLEISKYEAVCVSNPVCYCEWRPIDGMKSTIQVCTCWNQD